jgi:hypothetical protein
MTKIYDYNVEAFTNENAISYYLLGAFMTDGHVSYHEMGVEVGITSKDADWLQMIADIVCPKMTVVKRNRNDSISYSLRIYCKEIAHWFVSKGCSTRKSLTLEFPKIGEIYLPDFLRGVMDGDGSISFGEYYRKDRGIVEKKRQVAIYTSSKAFEEGLHIALKSLGVEPFTYVRKFGPRLIEDRIITSERENYRVALKSGEEMCHLLKQLYYPNNPIAIPRKSKIAWELINDWERERFCHECEIKLPFRTGGRCQLYCEQCANEKQRLSHVAAGRKYRAKKDSGEQFKPFES